MKPQILLVDDEHDLVNLVRYNLLKEGYDVLCAYDGLSALDLIWRKKPDLIVLDLMLPDKSGFDICRQIKADEATREIPVIMLTARSSEEDRINGFESGAEDYVVKPFSPKELVLRVKAMLARAKKDLPQAVQAGPLVIFPQQHRALLDNQELSLTQIEFSILLTLAQHPNIVRTREQLLSMIWKDEATEILDRTVDAHVKRLRGKLGDHRDCVETVRGIGYRFIIPKDTSTAAAPSA